jgi:hypothetical protein
MTDCKSILRSYYDNFDWNDNEQTEVTLSKQNTKIKTQREDFAIAKFLTSSS